MSIGPNSRHNHSAVMRVVDNQGTQLEPDHLDIRTRLQLSSLEGSTEHLVAESDNWSRISWKRLGNGIHYWVIADASDIVDPFRELHPPMDEVYVAQLTALYDSASSPYLQFNNVRRITMGDTLIVRSLTTGGFIRFTVKFVDTTQKRVVPDKPYLEIVNAATIAADTSQVVRLVKRDVRLTVPSFNRTVLEALDFGNQKNKLPEV